MVIDMTDFEYQKENIIPLPQGRSAKVLSALYARDSVIEKIHDTNTPTKDSDSLTGKELREIRRKEFENELKDVDEVDDPLDTYFKYINWLQDNYPTGNDTETGLLSLLETVLKKYQSDPRYLNDSRYLRLWFLYAHYSQEPIEIFKFLSVNDIGQNLSTYYEEYAIYMETQNKYKEANEIYTLGINRKAQPIERLKKRYIEFQKRMILTANKPADDEDSSQKDDNHIKSSFLNTKSKTNSKRIPLQVKHVSSTASDFSYIGDQNRNPNVGGGNNTTFTIFEDKGKSKDIKDELFGNHKEYQNQKDIFSSEQTKLTKKGSLILPSAEDTNEWTELGSHNLRRKENVRELESWNNVTIPQKASLINRRFSNGRSPVSFKIYEDPVEPDNSSPIMKTPTITRQENNKQFSNSNSNEKPKSIEVHRCLMNMIYAKSITNLYKEIVKEKERIITRKRAGLRNERMNENLKKLDEKTFNKIKKNIDWSYNPQKNEYYNSFECKNISEFSIEEIRAKYNEKSRTKKSREEEIGLNTIRSPLNTRTLSNSSHHSKDDSVTNRPPPLKKNKSLSEMNIQSNIINNKAKTKDKVYHSHDNNDEDKENQMKEDHYYEIEENEDEETRYTVKQDLKLFIPHDLSSETFSPPSIPRTRLLTTKILNASNDMKHSSPQHSQHILSSQSSSLTSVVPSMTSPSPATTLHSTSSILSAHSNSSSTLLEQNSHSTTPCKSSRTHTSTSTTPSSSVLKNYQKSPYTPSSGRHRLKVENSSSTFINSNSKSNSESQIDPFSRHDSFHYKNSPTVTIHTKNAFAAVYEWFNEPCDEENMDNLYVDNTMTNSDIDNTFFLKKKNKK